MKKSLKVLSFVALLALLSSFRPESTANFIGTYGVSESDPSAIRLELKADNSFTYRDPNYKVDLSGTWVQKGHKVLLLAKNCDKRFHKVWSFDKEGKVAKSRLALCFYRLCKIDG